MIPLRAKDGSIRAYAVVDPEDLDDLSQYRWSISGDGCAMRKTPRDINGRQATILMHRQILGLTPGDGLEGDHKDRDKLNNRRYNLRVATHALNSQNQDARGYRGSSSRFRGVSLRKLTGKWKAQIRISGKLHFLGYFDDEEEAGRVAAEARKQMMSFTEN